MEKSSIVSRRYKTVSEPRDMYILVKPDWNDSMEEKTVKKIDVATFATMLGAFSGMAGLARAR
jgi:hypothetical protein